MRLTIIPIDGAVYVDGSAVSGLSFAAPAGVHALQWVDTAGWIEYTTGAPNAPIAELPAWALEAVDVRASKLPVLDTPEFDPLTQLAVEIAPAIVDGVWTQQWRIDALSAEQIAANLTALKASKVTAIKAERDRRKFNGVFVSGKWIHTDTYSRTQWMGMVMMGASVPAIEWTTMDNTSITTSQALAGAVFQATATLDSTLFAFAKSLIDTVNASSDPTSVDITTGWPATFEGA